MAKFVHACEGQLVCKQIAADQVPKFNSPVYFQNLQTFGKVDEIFGPVTDIVCDWQSLIVANFGNSISL